MPGTEQSWIRTEASRDGLEWTRAYFRNVAFSPHRHDTYTIGCTDTGVQSFEYRRETWNAVAGDVFVIHPDELHDGRSGDNSAFGYRSIVVSPQDIARAYGVDSLPFNKQAVTRNPDVRLAVLGVLALAGMPGREVFAAVDALADLATALYRNCDNKVLRRRPLDVEWKTIQQIYERLSDAPTEQHQVSDIEQESGLDRFTLSRLFKRRYGTSPYRFLVQRRLDVAKALIRDAYPLADVAAAAGFSDQSHFTRQFRAANGLSPGQWRALLQRDTGIIVSG
ncbi:MAG: AraC family transcriptional regulator [Alphaproteobacteria bacterium]|nr:AraC family transcriptional regulator [Alphaproteobacteria bacterium]